MSRRITGSCELTIQRTNRIAMLLSMIVTITSCAPVRALSTPGMKPYRPPPTMPASRMIGISRIPGSPASQLQVPTHAATVAPTRSWPSAPMLNRPALNAKATASAAPMNGVERPSEAAIRSGRAEHPPQQRPVGLDRVLADEQDDARRRRPAPPGWRRAARAPVAASPHRAAAPAGGRAAAGPGPGWAPPSGRPAGHEEAELIAGGVGAVRTRRRGRRGR